MFYNAAPAHAESLSSIKAPQIPAACGGWLDIDSFSKGLFYNYAGESHLQQEGPCTIARGVGCFTTPSNNSHAGVVVNVEFYENGNYIATDSRYITTPLNTRARYCYGGAAYSVTPGTNVTITIQFAANINVYLGAVVADWPVY